VSKIKLPDPDESWAKVELWRWQYGSLPQPDDMRPLDVSKGLQEMAAAIRKGDRANFPAPFNVIAVLEYAAKLIANIPDQTRPASSGTVGSAGEAK
jgi:hypothetical protein